MMSEAMAPAAAGSTHHRPPSGYRRVRAALTAEWIKLRSLRSMPVTLTLAAVFCIGLATSVCSNYVRNWPTFDAAAKAAFNPLDTNFNFLVIGVLFFGVLGALVVTNEYGNGLIRATFAATPQRGLVLTAKTALFALIALSASAVICFTAFLTGQGVLAGHIPHVTLADPGVLGRVLGAVFYTTAVGVIGVFIGVLARGTAVAMSSVFGIMLVLPIMVSRVPQDTPVWRYTVPYLPSNLGNALWHSPVDGLTSPTVAALGLSAYVIVLGALAALSLRRRDA
jgi:ABC-2 type transport system permease protein